MRTRFRSPRRTVVRRLAAPRPLAVAAAVGYVLGTFPTADLVSRRLGAGDLRAAGSGNPGAANALQVLGAKAGLAVMGGDIVKGVVAGVAGRSVAGPVGAHVAATASVIGHCWPVWNGFRGGKGVATSVGQCLFTFPAYFPVDLAVAAVTAANPRWKQRAFAATTVSSVCWVLGGVVWWRRAWPNLWGPRATPALPVASAVSSAVILHRFWLGRRGPAAPRPPVPQSSQ